MTLRTYARPHHEPLRNRRSPDLRISFPKASALLLDRLGPKGASAALVLRELLSDAAREHLAEREAAPTP